MKPVLAEMVVVSFIQRDTIDVSTTDPYATLPGRVYVTLRGVATAIECELGIDCPPPWVELDKRFMLELYPLDD
jgi:hypothetical protein